MPAIHAVPYRHEANDHFHEVEGLLRFEGDALTFEYRVRDVTAFTPSSDWKTVILPLDELLAATLKSGFFGAKLTLGLRSMAALADMPGQRPGALVLSFARKHRRQAADLAATLALRLSERKLERLDEEWNELE